MEKMSKKDLQSQLKLYEEVLKKNRKNEKSLLKSIARYKKEIAKYD